MPYADGSHKRIEIRPNKHRMGEDDAQKWELVFWWDDGNSTAIHMTDYDLLRVKNATEVKWSEIQSGGE